MHSLSRQILVAGGLALVMLAGPAPARGDEIPKEYRATVKKGLIWSTGPTVNVALLVPQERDGKTYYPTGGYRLGSNIIDISMGDVGRFQTDQDMRTTARGQVHLITIILLHELTHWAREKSGTSDSPDVEDGFEFEKEVYGKVFER